MLRHLASFLAIISICAMIPDWTESAEPAEFAQHVLTRTILQRGTAFARTCILERTAGLTTGQRPLQAKAKPWFGAVSGRQWQDEHGFGAVSGRPLQSDTHWLGAVSGRQMQEQVRLWFGAVSCRQLQDACKSPHILYVVCYAHFEAFTVLTRFMRLLHIVTQTLAVHSSNTIYRESWEQFAVPSEEPERGETPNGDTFDNSYLQSSHILKPRLEVHSNSIFCCIPALPTATIRALHKLWRRHCSLAGRLMPAWKRRGTLREEPMLHGLGSPPTPVDKTRACAGNSTDSTPSRTGSWEPSKSRG